MIISMTNFMHFYQENKICYKIFRDGLLLPLKQGL